MRSIDGLSRVVRLLALAAIATIAGPGSHSVAFAKRLEFEVASVKRNTSDRPPEFHPRRSGDLVTMHNTQPYSLIAYAYRIKQGYEVAGYPDLPDNRRWFDIDARIGRNATDDEVRLMFQSLLADRFKLQIHRETREMVGYELVIDKGKANLAVSKSQEPMTVPIEGKSFPQSSGTCSTSFWIEGPHLVCHAAPMRIIAAQVSGELHSPVVDHTGLTGLYDLNLRFMEERSRLDREAEPGPSLPQALQEQLGLKLKKAKTLVEVIVIDHFEAPSEN